MKGHLGFVEERDGFNGLEKHRGLCTAFMAHFPLMMNVHWRACSDGRALGCPSAIRKDCTQTVKELRAHTDPCPIARSTVCEK